MISEDLGKLLRVRRRLIIKGIACGCSILHSPFLFPNRNLMLFRYPSLSYEITYLKFDPNFRVGPV